MGVQKWDVSVVLDGGRTHVARPFVADWWTDGKGGLSQQIYDWLTDHGYVVTHVTLTKGIDGYGAAIHLDGHAVLAQVSLRAASVTASGVG